MVKIVAYNHTTEGSSPRHHGEGPLASPLACPRRDSLFLSFTHTPQHLYSAYHSFACTVTLNLTEHTQHTTSLFLFLTPTQSGFSAQMLPKKKKNFPTHYINKIIYSNAISIRCIKFFIRLWMMQPRIRYRHL